MAAALCSAQAKFWMRSGVLHTLTRRSGAPCTGLGTIALMLDKLPACTRIA